MDRDALKAQLEAIIYVSEEPVTLGQLEKALPEVTREELRAALEELVAAGRTPARGLEIRQVAGGYRMYTKTEHHEAVRKFVRSQKPPLRLSLPALETLAVIAYKQPVTQPEIKAIRGVDPESALATLLEKGLVVTAGRKEAVGRPILYRTSKEFLLRFGLKDVGELPTLEEFEELARASLGEPETSPAGEPPSEGSAEQTEAEAGNA
ncbi:MAG: SMC-Scp complex subunit ScpB [Acidobacteria bacterium RIFCSPHIGHO2_12_FULL_67_30]|nr:MAG: SMC-Scp complex subunit ScpB [Acidobacteria bacterium RIFCSPHIGHO2_02_FULL_67_57]OFV84866.1 MAG: SMC-Scp complex subunit ScpB [Acidobacteria bacterium RIFCSPHIGHO2_01_FULL_67_28]OFV86714.1 MAG: SMC-Scp complex subunit ScpB [Acidobacteria bacterium RIFCSPHIGHO2_12_FULL_67_30]